MNIAIFNFSNWEENEYIVVPFEDGTTSYDIIEAAKAVATRAQQEKIEDDPSFKVTKIHNLKGLSLGY